MFSELENKVVVITGSGSGINGGSFGKEKAKVVLNYRSENHMEELDALQETIKNLAVTQYGASRCFSRRCETISRNGC